MATRKLIPLGDPAPNAPNWFAAVEFLQLTADVNWLNKATKEVGKYWRHKRERRQNRLPVRLPKPPISTLAKVCPA